MHRWYNLGTGNTFALAGTKLIGECEQTKNVRSPGSEAGNTN